MVPPPPKLILLLMTDQFRQDALDPIMTPQLWHELKEDPHSTTFTNAYSSTPVCTPARAALLTGKSPWNHGMLGYANTVNCEQYPAVLPEILHDLANYTTTSVGKNHFGWRKDGTYVTHGFQHTKIYDAMTHQPYPDDYMKYYKKLHPNVSDPLDNTCQGRTTQDYNEWKSCAYGGGPEEEHPTEWTTRTAIEFLEEFFVYPGSNLFLKVSYHRPHSPYDPPKRILEERLKGHVPARTLNISSWDAMYQNSTEMPTNAWYGDPGDEAARESRAGYLGSCQFVDEGVGELISWLKEHGLWDETLVVWTTDHGDMNGDHNLWRKGYAYEGSAHVNMIWKMPAAASSGALPESDALVETRDIAVTLYDYLGILEKAQARDPLMDGKSLLPILDNRQEHVRDWLDLEMSTLYRDDIHWNAIVGWHDAMECELWKYIFHVQHGEEQVFCLTTDRNEHVDLAKDATAKQVLQYWRETMVDMFEQQQRGDGWVKNGTLVAGRPGIKRAHHFPCNSARFQEPK